jgi:hypothetical protein
MRGRVGDEKAGSTPAFSYEAACFDFLPATSDNGSPRLSFIAERG